MKTIDIAAGLAIGSLAALAIALCVGAGYALGQRHEHNQWERKLLREGHAHMSDGAFRLHPAPTCKWYSVEQNPLYVAPKDDGVWRGISREITN